MQRRRRINPKEDAKYYIDTKTDKVGLDVKYINAFKGRGIFATTSFQKGDFLCEYQGELISKEECERRQKVYHDKLKVFLFEFYFNGKLWCVDAAKEDCSLGRLVNDDNISPNAKMKYLTVQQKPHLCLFATRDINQGEEITYNYGDSDWPWRLKNSSGMSSTGQDVEVPSTSQLVSYYGMVSSKDQIRAENDQDQMTTNVPNETDPVLDSLPINSECQKHHLMCTTVSSLEKCTQCFGPSSSFKWVGYQCKGCSKIWHSYCLKKITKDDRSQAKELFKYSIADSSSDNNTSPSKQCEMSDEDHASDIDYIPNSETAETDEDSDISIPLQPIKSKVGQIQGNPTIPDLTSFLPDSSSVVEPCTSNYWPPFHTDDMGDGTFKTFSPAKSTKDSNDKPKCQKEPHKQESSQHIMSAKNYCFVCGRPQTKISRHLKTHKTHAEIAYAFSLPEDSKERKVLLEKMRNKGNFKHNCEVLQSGKGSLKVKRKPKAKTGTFIHCMYCQGMYIRKELWRHVQRCPCKPQNEDLNQRHGRTKVLGFAMAQESAFCQEISSGVWKLLGPMKQDDVATVVRNDLTIIQLAQSLYNRHGQDPTKYEYIRQKLREIGRLLICLRSEFSVHNLEEAVKPANFQRVVQAVKIVCGFDEEKHSYQTPSLALKLGHTLQKISDIIHCRALMAEDEELIKSTDTFKKLYTSKWSELVSHTALNTLSHAKYNKPLTLPFTEDVQSLHRYLKESGENAFSNLKDEVSPQNYAKLAKVTLAQVIVFNRRRAGEVSKMHLRGFQQRDDSKLHEDVAAGLSKVEKKLCSYFSRVEIIGKRGRKVAVLLSPDVVDALTLLVSKREQCGVCSTNIFLFARPRSQSHYRGQDCLRVYGSQCGAKHPEFLRSTQLRKHVATLSQVLNLKNNEIDQVADFLGHDIRVHREFYRLPVPTTQLAKISKLLLSMEKGHVSTLQGKSLDDIEIEDEIELSEDEEKEDLSDLDDCDSVEPEEPVEPVEPVEPEEPVEPVVPVEPVEPDQSKNMDNLLGAVSSTAEEIVPSVEETSSVAPRRQPKKPWSSAEISAVMRHFKAHIGKGKLATKNECNHCKLVEGPVLAQRTAQNIRDFVRNRGITAKRQAQKKRL
ncbi:uncharacterized protein LOC122834482 isoform X2 [Gambusia affinis]|uniref:uncharacterized protein LOC122834482 isoform X2 n=1 Tax=Gambusia affinis TaxID=33528 RepID=UPI001CDC753F|nr:uncharacterized protein LOC122834482 isoform X2 [Gambusia affinis]